MPASLRCELFPADLDATVRFYRDVLAFDVVRDDRDGEIPYLALRRGAVHVGVVASGAAASGPRRPPVGVELVLEVDDLAADRARVAASGWPVEEDVTPRPWGLTDFRLVDPDGYYWRITDRVRQDSGSVLGEDDALEVLAYLVTAARTQVDEAAEYGPLRLLTAARRLGAAIAARSSPPTAAFVEDTLERLPELAVPRQGREEYVARLDAACRDLAALLVGRLRE